MSNEVWQETFEEQTVTYVLEQQGKVLIMSMSRRACAGKRANGYLPQKPWNACNKLSGSKERQRA
jgi:hypothetical protein